MACSGVLVDNEKYVAYVYRNSALKLRFIRNIARHGLPVAVEGDANELPFCIDQGRTGIASRDVVARNDSDRYAARLVGIRAKILGLVQFLKAGRNLKLWVAGIFLLHYAVEVGNMVVLHSVAGLVASHMAVGHAHRRVRIRRPNPRRQHLANARSPEAVGLGLHGRQGGILTAEVGRAEVFGHLGQGVVGQCGRVRIA